MKTAYEILRNDLELNHILKNTNFNMNRMMNFANGVSGKNYTFCCHGKHHALYVVKAMKLILSSLSYDAHTIELGKVAGLLHDIGNYYGRHEHARVGASMCLHFVSKTNLDRNDLKIIEQAVLDHSSGEDIQSAVGAALLIADKLPDINRGATAKSDLARAGFNNKAELNKYDKKPDVTDFQLTIEERDLIFNYTVKEDAEAYINLKILNEQRRPIILTKKAAAFLGCSCIYKVNDAEVTTKEDNE